MIVLNDVHKRAGTSARKAPARTTAQARPHELTVQRDGAATSLGMWFTSRAVPVTGRHQSGLLPWPASQADRMIEQMEAQGLVTLPKEHPTVRRVQRIATRLIHSLALLDPHPDAHSYLVRRSLRT